MPTEHSVVPILNAFTHELRARRQKRLRHQSLVAELSQYNSSADRLELQSILDRAPDEHSAPIRNRLRWAS